MFFAGGTDTTCLGLWSSLPVPDRADYRSRIFSAAVVLACIKCLFLYILFGHFFAIFWFLCAKCFLLISMFFFVFFLCLRVRAEFKLAASDCFFSSTDICTLFSETKPFLQVSQ